MRFAILGTGAVGGYYGGLLQRNGHDVVFISRGRTLEALREQGLTLQSIIKGDEWTEHLHPLQVYSVDMLEGMAPVDTVIIAVKSQDTVEAVKQVKPFVGDDTIICTIQNGIDNEEKLVRLFPNSKLVSGVAYVAAEMIEPAMIEIKMGGRLTIGDYREPEDQEISTPISPEVQHLAEIFSTSGIPTQTDRNMMHVKWRKLVWNIGFNTLTALCRTTPGRIIENEYMRPLVTTIMAETLAVAASYGYHLEHALIDKILQKTRSSTTEITSMLQDVLRGKPLEIDAIVTVVKNKGRSAGVPTPTIDIIHGLLTELDAKSIAG